MIRIAAALSILALAACAKPPSPQAMDPRAPEAAQVYQALQLQQFELQMTDPDKQMTYGYAAVNCGLRDPHWRDMLQAVYQTDYQMEFRRHPLTPEQASEAQSYAAAHISNPTPPPYICERISSDSALPQLDAAVGMESLILSTQKKPTG